METTSPSVILVMGVSGSGKTTVGQLLAKRLEGSFLDADDLHPSTNIDKMARGESLNDKDRWPWLDAVTHAASIHTSPTPLVLACSALKESYRERLQLGDDPVIFLTGSRETIAQRLSLRQGHFMPSQLLDSQLGELEEPKKAISISIAGTPYEIVDQIIRSL